MFFLIEPVPLPATGIGVTTSARQGDAAQFSGTPPGVSFDARGADGETCMVSWASAVGAGAFADAGRTAADVLSSTAVEAPPLCTRIE